MDDKINILYVDDELLNLELFKINFENKFNVFTAINGKTGLKVLEEFKQISIVLSDMRMPVMNGLDFIRNAKMIYPELKFFLLTGYEITNEIQDAIAEGYIIQYISKPFKMAEIEQAIESVK